MSLGKTPLFKFNRTDIIENMTVMGKSCMYYILRERSGLAESIVQIITDWEVAVNATT